MNTKKWYASKTVWASIIAILIAAWNATVVQFPHVPAIPDWVYPILAALGLAGRVTATTTLTK
jgi:hypothetical protein